MTNTEVMKQALIEPVQKAVKPYAYEYGRDNGDGTYSVVIDRGSLEQTGDRVYSYARPRNTHKDHPIKELFDSPVQQEWVGLTEEEAIDIGMQYQWYDEDCERFDSIGFTYAIETRLKEKNTKKG
jgi:hypothetical protein